MKISHSYRILATTASALFTLASANAGSATWNQVPSNGEWTNASNWTPAMVPNGPADTATFHTSNIATLTIASSVEAAGIVFNSGASLYTISPAAGASLTLSGAGITNQSNRTQSFNIGGETGDNASVIFANSASAGSLTSFVTNGATATGEDGGQITFNDSSSAGTTTIFNNGGAVASGSPGEVQFTGNSSASGATITNDGSKVLGGVGSLTIFSDTATAANATLTSNGGFHGGLGSSFRFLDSSSGGLARGIPRGNGNVDISGLTLSGTTFGSIEGSGNIFLGSKALTVGGNNLDTLMTGVIQDGGQAGGVGGSLIKVGTGSLNLSGPNTYGGGTMVTMGTLLISNVRASGTGNGPVTVSNGTLGGTGVIAGLVTIAPAAGQVAALAPGIQVIGTLTLNRSLTLAAKSSYICETDLTSGKSDQVKAKGVTIDRTASFTFTVVRSGALPPGTVLTPISNTDTTPINGIFGNLRDNSVFRAGDTKFRVSYSGGDGNDLTLTAL